MEWQVLPDADAVTREAFRIIGETARRAIADRRRSSLVLAGGTTPAAAYRLLAAADQAWDRWEIWFGHEHGAALRFVPAGATRPRSSLVSSCRPR